MWSPDDATIAIETQRDPDTDLAPTDLYLVPTDGSAPRRLDPAGTWISTWAPAWSGARP